MKINYAGMFLGWLIIVLEPESTDCKTQLRERLKALINKNDTLLLLLACLSNSLAGRLLNAEMEELIGHFASRRWPGTSAELVKYAADHFAKISGYRAEVQAPNANGGIVIDFPKVSIKNFSDFKLPDLSVRLTPCKDTRPNESNNERVKKDFISFVDALHAVSAPLKDMEKRGHDRGLVDLAILHNLEGYHLACETFDGYQQEDKKRAIKEHLNLWSISEQCIKDYKDLCLKGVLLRINEATRTIYNSNNTLNINVNEKFQFNADKDKAAYLEFLHFLHLLIRAGHLLANLTSELKIEINDSKTLIISLSNGPKTTTISRYVLALECAEAWALKLQFKKQGDKSIWSIPSREIENILSPG